MTSNPELENSFGRERIMSGMDSHFVFGETTDIREALNPTWSVKDRAALNMIEKAELEIKKRFGKNAIMRGISLEKGATAKERNDQIGGHKA